MSSNIEIKRICQHCNTEFIARTTVTKYCSQKCASKAYKARKRSEKINQSKKDTTAVKSQTLEAIKNKEFLSIGEVCILLGISRRTIYRTIERGDLKKFKLAARTIIKRSDIDNLLNLPQPTNNNISTPLPNKPDFLETYTIGEIENKFNISGKGLYTILNKNNVPKQKRGKYTHVPKSIIDELFM